MESIEQYLLAREDVTHVTTSIGGTPSRYNLVRSMADPSLAYGELIVDYVSSDRLVASIDEIQQYLTEHYPDAYVRLKRYNLMYKKYPIEVEFTGPDPAVLRDLTRQAMDIMNASDDIFLVNTDWESKTPVLVVDYNQPVARSIGLSRQDVGLSLLSATGGIPTGTFYEGTEPQTIYVKCLCVLAYPRTNQIKKKKHEHSTYIPTARQPAACAEPVSPGHDGARHAHLGPLPRNGFGE